MTEENRPIHVAVDRTNGEENASTVPPPHEKALSSSLSLTPLIDIHEGPEGLILEADLPGATEEGLRIQLEHNVLSLYAKVGSPAPEGAQTLHEEYYPGDFQRTFILSDEVERDRITAEFKHGVLRLFLPNADRVKTRRIEIKS